MMFRVIFIAATILIVLVTLLYQKSQKPPSSENNINKPVTTTHTPQPPVSAMTTLLNSINNTPIVYESNNHIYFLKSSNAQPMIIAKDGSSPQFSPDRTKIAYIASDDKYIYIYNVPQKATTKFVTQEYPLRNLIWSPDDKYFVLEAGTDVVGQGSIYSYPSAKRIATFSTVGGISANWTSDSNYIYNEAQEINPSRPWGSGVGEGISEIILPTGTKRTLLQANAQSDFDLINVSDDIIAYQITDINNYADPKNQLNSPSGTYETITPTNLTAKQISRDTIFHDENTVALHLPLTLKGFQVTGCVPNTHDSTWLLCNFYKTDEKSQQPVDKFGSFNLAAPQLGVQAVTKGTNAQW